MRLNPIWDVAFAVSLASVGIWYFRGRPEQAGISKWRQGLFAAALILAFIVLVGPVPHLAIRLFWVHMVQHILLMMLISPMLVLGSPFRLALGSPTTGVGRIARRLANFQLIRQLFRPPVGFAIFLATLIATHFSPLANAGMTNPNVHCLELILFLVAGVIYYYPVMDGNPTPYPVAYSTRVASLFAMMLPETMTGFFLYSGNRLLHSVSMEMPTSSGMNPLRDQHFGGALMWAMGMLIDSVWVVLAARDWFENEKRLAEREDENIE